MNRRTALQGTTLVLITVTFLLYTANNCCHDELEYYDGYVLRSCNDFVKFPCSNCPPREGLVGIFVAYTNDALAQRMYRLSNATLQCYWQYNQQYKLFYVNIDTDERVLKQCGHIISVVFLSVDIVRMLTSGLLPQALRRRTLPAVCRLVAGFGRRCGCSESGTLY